MMHGGNWFDRVLIISPHSDDETLSLGGTICKIKENGGNVRVIVAVAGDIVFWHNDRIEVPASERVVELKAAMEHLGVDSWRIIFKERNLESRLDTIPIRDLVYELDKEIENYRPGTIFIPRHSYHQDHRAVHDASVAACRPNTDKFLVPRVMEYEYPANIWNGAENVSWANFFVSISEEQLDRKIQAFQKHMSQQRKDDNVLSMNSIRIWSTMRGLSIGEKYAEAMRIWRCIE